MGEVGREAWGPVTPTRQVVKSRPNRVPSGVAAVDPVQRRFDAMELHKPRDLGWRAGGAASH